MEKGTNAINAYVKLHIEYNERSKQKYKRGYQKIIMNLEAESKIYYSITFILISHKYFTQNRIIFIAKLLI